MAQAQSQEVDCTGPDAISGLPGLKLWPQGSALRGEHRPRGHMGVAVSQSNFIHKRRGGPWPTGGDLPALGPTRAAAAENLPGPAAPQDPTLWRAAGWGGQSELIWAFVRPRRLRPSALAQLPGAGGLLTSVKAALWGASAHTSACPFREPWCLIVRHLLTSAERNKNSPPGRRLHRKC